MNQDSIMKMLAAQLGQAFPGMKPDEKAQESTWLESFQDKVKAFQGTPYQPLAKALLNAQKPLDISSLTINLSRGADAERNPFQEHPEIPDELTAPANPFLNAFWPPEWVPLVAKSMEYAFSGIYQTSLVHRTYRTGQDKSAYAIVRILSSLFEGNRTHQTPEEFALKRMKREMTLDVLLAPFLAVMLDSGNPAIMEAFRSAIFENTGTVSRELLLALFFSRKEANWKMAADLLLAAKLQEGLRQTVLESCSDGRLDAFLYMMHVIADNDLLRYSATVRAFDTWLGLGFESERANTVKQMFASALSALEHPESFKADNPRDQFIHLWAIANAEVLEAKRRVEEMLTDGSASSPEICAALTFYQMTGYHLSNETALAALTKYREDHAVTACLLECYKIQRNSSLTSGEAARLYFEFKKLLPYYPKKQRDFLHPVFAWIPLRLSVFPLWFQILLPLGKIAWTAPVLDDLAQSMPEMTTDVRHFMFIVILDYLAPPKVPQHVWQRVSEAQMEVDKKLRETMPHTPTLREALFCALEDKSSSNREEALSIIARMVISESECLRVENMLSLKTPAIRRLALDILRKSGNPQASALRLRASGNAEKIAAANELAPADKTAEILDRAHGFGLYDPKKKPDFRLPDANPAFHPKEILQRMAPVVVPMLEEFDAFACKFQNTEVIYNSAKTTFGNALDSNPFNSIVFEMPHLPPEQFPVPVVSFFTEHFDTEEKLFGVLAYLTATSFRPDCLKLFYGTPPPPKTPFRLSHAAGILAYHNLLDGNHKRDFAEQVMLSIAAYTAPEVWTMNQSPHDPFPTFCLPEFRWIWTLARRVPCNSRSIAWYMALHRHFVAGKEIRFSVFKIDNLLQAREAGLVDDGEVVRYLLEPDAQTWQWIFRKSLLHPVMQKAVHALLEIELKRGETPTELSEYFVNLPVLSGVEYFVKVLKACGNTPFVRGFIYGGHDRINVFSNLLKVSRPLPGDDADALRRWLKQYPIPDKKLLEAAMYSPAWLGIVGDYMQIPELPLAGWYFHAHLSERMNFYDTGKDGNIAKYSAITPQEFNDGAFDIDWFHEAYQAVGPEIFAKLYDAAKYISGGANHRRSQIFADAALGKLKEADMELNMTAKRNKEYVMAYGILPGGDFLRRYENLVQFRKESRQFGGQRQASEKLAVEIALGNLARTAGFSDVNRFLWRMESAQLDTLKPLFVPRTVGDVTVSLVIDDSGRADLKIGKKGGMVKSLPAALKKNEIVLELQDAVKKLREQHSRAKKSLEEAMIHEDVFEYTEVKELFSNPVLGPLVSKLLWQSGARIDFFDRLPETPLTIAHPVGLLKSGHWAEFQRHALEIKLLQPFKQIFRELYTLNEDEKLDGMKSDRYSGNQVLPKQAVALLRTRGWTVDMEDGLQKVFHKQNMIVKIYAMFDWFSPAEVEPPTLEYVQFEHRRTGEIIPLEKIPPVLFSEVMRDIDLMVSVAHAGGVDPEASHSTVEMRAALIAAMLPLFKLANVRIEKSHAFITGKFGEYNVHLGSGVCHQQAHGMLNILPVHSQTRGRLFLPFADDDPKTSEIVTRILFLAEDDKIKDPSILEQIKGDRP